MLIKIITLILIFFLTIFQLSAQNSQIKGVITDTTSKENLFNAVIALLRAKDSVLYKFSRSKQDGTFEISNIDSGKYVMLITYNRYADYVDAFFTDGTSSKDFGSVMMTLKEHLLQDVVIRQKIAAIRMKGDTLEFNADSFKVREGASTEDLLKTLPGIQVDKDGNITAQGEKIQKVMVDGEEFFGDDPTLATQNIQADAIDKVQVFDKKSDQAAFTGIDDGTKTKTINLTLKEDKKKGYFGKLDVGGGLNDRWSNTAMINDFKGKKKVSAYGIMSSTGRTGLNWEERESYGSGGGPEYNDDFGGFMFYSNNEDEFDNSSYYGNGVPKSWSGGVNFSNKFNEDKQNFNGSYRFNKINTSGSGSSFSQSILPDSVFYNNEQSINFNSRQRHSVNGIYEWQIDSSTSIKITAKGYIGKQDSYSSYSGESLNDKGGFINKSARNTSSSGDNKNADANFIFRKKFKKAGRTLSFNASMQSNNNNSDGFLYALNSFYSGNSINAIDTTDQKKANNTFTSVFNGKVTYTEPIVKNVFTEINYSARISKSNAERLSYDKSISNKYESYNDTFSSHYAFDVFTNTVGLAFKYNTKKVTASAGTDVAKTNFRQTDLLKVTLQKRDYNNFFPRANFTYKFNQSSRIYIGYNGRSQQPSITEIQPVADNSNPLVITIGNPYLNQEFSHNINFNLNTYKVFSQTGFFVYGNFSATHNAIVTSNTTDTLGRTIYQYLNTNGNHNA